MGKRNSGEGRERQTDRQRDRKKDRAREGEREGERERQTDKEGGCRNRAGRNRQEKKR